MQETGTPEREGRVAEGFYRSDSGSESEGTTETNGTAHCIWCRIRAELPKVKVAECATCRYVRKRKMALTLVGQELFVPQSYRWGKKPRWTGMKPMRTLPAKERTAKCFACGAWPVEEPSIVLSHMPAGRPFSKRTSGRSLTLAGYSKSFA